MSAKVLLVDVEGNSALHALSEATRAALFELGQVRTFESNEILYHDGGAAGVVLFPLKGALQMSKGTPRGRQQIMCQMGRAPCGGICLLLFSEHAPAEVRATEAGLVLEVERSLFQPLMRRDPELCQLAWQSAANCMTHLSDMVAQLSFNTVVERVARMLVDHTLQDGDTVHLTQAQFAAAVGTTREVVARCLGELQTAGWIRLGRGRTVVLDRDALRNTY